MADQDEEDVEDEEALLRDYLNKGYTYDEVIALLKKDYNIEYSYRTLKRRCKLYGLGRRHFDDHNFATALERIQVLLEGPHQSSGYRMIWHQLRNEGIHVPRHFVQSALREIDPEGTELRKARRLVRRTYINPGPNYAWHLDGYDKLKPYGFPIHGAIDGYSRKILWLRVTRSNNSPQRILKFFLDAVDESNGCPLTLISDLGTENGLAAATQCYFHDSIESHKYVPSPRNQRIESWWAQLSKQRSLWWRSFFADLEHRNIYDRSIELHREAVWFTFSPIIQSDLDSIKSLWNSHYIRKSRNETVAGRPNLLYSLPERYGGTEHLQEVNLDDREYIDNNVLEVNDEANEYVEYFEYVVLSYPLQYPVSIEEGINFLTTLIQFSEG